MGEAPTAADAIMVAPSRARAYHAIIASGDNDVCDDFSDLFVALDPTKATARSERKNGRYVVRQ